MNVRLGVKTDPIQNRFSYDWLFRIMKKHGVPDLQLGGFFELPLIDDEFFLELREMASGRGVRIKSVFSSHREMSGFFSGNTHMEKAARAIYEKFIHVGMLAGADYVGSSAGSVLRDKKDEKEKGIRRYFSHMEELMHLARDKGLKGLTVEVMSCAAEPPTFPAEIDRFTAHFAEYREKHPSSTVPVYLLGDISHGYANEREKVINTNWDLFEHSIPNMSEFHFKNTDALFNETFGFSEGDSRKGIVYLEKLREIVARNASRWPVEEVTGYLELPGPKLGRDYSDWRLETMLNESLAAIKSYF